MCCPSPAVLPSNQQINVHMPEFLAFGYKSAIGNIECKFPLRDGTRLVQNFSVGVTDGHTKIIIMMSIVGIARELELSNAELNDPQLSMVLASFGQVRCSYEHFQNPAHFFLYSLRTFSDFV